MVPQVHGTAVLVVVALAQHLAPPLAQAPGAGALRWRQAVVAAVVAPVLVVQPQPQPQPPCTEGIPAHLGLLVPTPRKALMEATLLLSTLGVPTVVRTAMVTATAVVGPMEATVLAATARLPMVPPAPRMVLEAVGTELGVA